jgi:hypothetical protein
MPSVSPLGPDGDGELAGGEVGHGQATSDGELKSGSLVIDLWRWFDRDGRRRAAAAA